MNLFDSKHQCYGCGACSNICSKNAIILKQDVNGFYYPEISSALCIECGLCAKVCQIGKETNKLNNKSEFCFGIKANDEIREHSSSGGIFTLISDSILKDNGVCVGVKYDEKFNVVFDVASTAQQRDKFCGSKYVQGDLRDVFKKVKHYLQSGTNVLFSGTPCQVNALNFFLESLNVDTNLLLTIDLVCHGVPSPKVWKEYVSELQETYNSELSEFTFRDKNSGWHGYHILAKFKNGLVIRENSATMSFVKLFTKDLMLRPSCYKCRYSSLNRTGDITIGDFWGIENIDVDFSDNQGVSLVMFNTEKAKKYLEDIETKIRIKKYETSMLKQHNLYAPTKKVVIMMIFGNFFLNMVIKR